MITQSQSVLGYCQAGAMPSVLKRTLPQNDGPAISWDELYVQGDRDGSVTLGVQTHSSDEARLFGARRYVILDARSRQIGVNIKCLRNDLKFTGRLGRYVWRWDSQNAREANIELGYMWIGARAFCINRYGAVCDAVLW